MGVVSQSLLGSSLAYLLTHLTILQPYVEVEIPLGRLRGAKTVARDGKPYFEFLNIPFAKPPLGNLRFEPPVPYKPWKGVLQATDYGNSCLQYEFITHLFVGSEDCLNLNVYTAQFTSTLTLAVYDVRFCFDSDEAFFSNFGGVFMSGFSFIYRAKYLMEEDVVLVTMNYRVSSFGFLNTGDGVVRGNMGLKDQVQGLRWIKDNIAIFGGDPSRVTLMGQSAGAASVHYHLLSKMSTGLFHRAISFSGTALQRWAFSKHPRVQAERLAKRLGCSRDNSSEMVTCLKNVHPHRIARSHKDFLNPLPQPATLFAPSVETVVDEAAFLTEEPTVLLRKGTYPNHVPWMTGVTNAEGLLGSGYLVRQPRKFQELEDSWSDVVGLNFGYRGHPKEKQIAEQIYRFYFGLKNSSHWMFDEVTRLYSDAIMYVWFAETLRLHMNSSSEPTYAYFFTYEREYGLGNHLTAMVGGGLPRPLDFGIGASRVWFRSKVNPQSLDKLGVCHADDVMSLFNVPVLAPEIRPGTEDYAFSKAFVELIVSFAKDGKPMDFMGVPWSPVAVDEDGTPRLFEIGRHPKTLSLPFKENIRFWRGLPPPPDTP